MPARKTTKPKTGSLKELALAGLQDAIQEAYKIELPCLQYQDKPAEFIQEVLGLILWEKQKEIVSCLPKNKRITVKSGHKVGKSTLAAAIAIWFYCCFPDARVVLTSSTYRQVQNILWREVKKIFKRAKYPIPGSLKELASSGLVHEFNEIKGFTAKDPEAMAGTSAPRLLYIVDEASGVEDRIFEAIEGNRAAGAWILLFSNPTKTSGQFYLSHTKNKELWKTFTISSEDTPNVKEGKEVIPGLAGKEWIEEKKKEWGEDSPIYGVRIKGNFPLSDNDTIVPLHLIESSQELNRVWFEDSDEAKELQKNPLYYGPLEIGVDPARFGDDETVICVVRNHRVIELIARNGFNSTEITGLIVSLINQHKTNRELSIPVVKIDAGGGYGSGVADQLLKHRKLCRVLELNGSTKSRLPTEFPLLRDELWFNVTKWLKEGGILPDDDKLAADLSSPGYTFTDKGQRKAESKKEIKKRLGRSPDRADALALAIYQEFISSEDPEEDDDDYEEELQEHRADYFVEIDPYRENYNPYR